VKRRTVSGGEAMRGPSRIKSMPNMHNGVDIAARRPITRRDRADTASTGARTKCAAVDASSRKLRTKSSTVRYSTTKGAETAVDEQATPPTTSGSSSVVVDIEATPTSFVGDRTSVPPQPPTPLRPEPESPISETSGEVTCLQSPVNSSGVRIVIDSDNNDDDNDRDDADHRWSLPTDAELGAAHRRHLPDGPETAATFGSITSGSCDDDSSNVVVLFQCGPSDDVDDDDAILSLLPVVGQP